MDEERAITPLPKAMPITAAILFILGLAATPLVQSAFTEAQLARNALLSGIPFILMFAAVILFFMSFIWFLSNMLNFRIAEKTYHLVERIIIAGIVLGVVGMFQPWFFGLFRYGFYLLLIATLAFMTWSHIAAAPAPDEFEQEPVS